MNALVRRISLVDLGAGGCMNTGRFIASVAIVVIAMSFVGCSTPMVGSSEVKYSYDPQFSFEHAKTYRWAETGSTYGRDLLLEANVRFLADRVLESKGLTSRTDTPALRISIRYDSSGYSHELRSLSMNVSRADTNVLVWRGVAAGSVRSDAASGDLPTAVQTILANFPPKAASAPQ
jgi:Domain of unknown function (DUF4136)